MMIDAFVACTHRTVKAEFCPPQIPTKTLSLPPVISGNCEGAGGAFYLDMLNRLIESNQSTLAMLEEQEKMTNASFDEMKGQLKQLMSLTKGGCHTFPKVQCPPAASLCTPQLALQLVDFPTTPLYAKRKFHIAFRVVDRNNDIVDFDQPLYCGVTVLKMTPTCEEVTKSRTGEAYAGKPILRGQVAKCFRPHETLSFQGLVFLDISSPFPQGRFTLLVRCVNFPDMKALLIEGVRVKARRKRFEDDS